MNYDSIVIGSGIGGLSCASFLALSDQKVLLLESNDVLGGCMQPVGNDIWTWNLGLQWICRFGPLDPDGMMLRLLTEDKIELNKLDDNFMRMDFPDLDNFKFVIRAKHKLMEKALIEEFPHEKHGIKKYYSLVMDINDKLLGLPAAKLFHLEKAKRVYPKLLKFLFPILEKEYRPLTETTLTEVVEQKLGIADPKLQAVLYSYWHFFGMPPQDIPILFYAVVVGLQENGVYYPKGGSRSIIDLLKQKIEKHGGQVKAGTPVEQIIVENGKAVGVVAGELGEVRANAVISSAGIRETIEGLLPKEDWNEEIKLTHQLVTSELKSIPTILILRVGLKGDLTPFNIGNVTYRTIKKNSWDFKTDPTSLDWEPTDITINFPSYYDTGVLDHGYHTAEVVQLTSYDYFKDVDPDSDQFQEAKQRISDKLQAILEERFPGIGQLVEFTMLTTPFDVKDLTRHNKAAVYGLDINKAADMQLQPHSGLDNLFFTGEDIFAQGVTLTNGMLTAGTVLGTNLYKKFFGHKKD